MFHSSIAERSKVKETRADDRAELKRLTVEHESLPKFAATSADGVKAARDAVTAAERAQRAECEKRGRLCREREGEEAAKREALERVLAARGLTERAERLEADMKRLRDRLDKGDVVRSANPQGAILAKLFRLPDSEADAAATWQQFAMSIVVDLLIMACFIAHEVMGWETRRPRKLAAEDVRVPVMPELPAPAAKPRLVASVPRPAGSVREFFASTFEVSIGRKVGMTSAYLAYAARCKARDRAAVTPEQFFEAMDQICRQNGFPVELVDGKPHLMNVQLTASSAAGQTA